MANIVITNYCNLQCPYCFANKYITEEEKQNITLDELNRILEWLGRTVINRIGIIGGEPTLHPRANEIFSRVKEFAQERKTRVILFSNGIKLYRYARLFDDNFGALINVNHPDVIGNEKWKELEKSLKMIKVCNGMNTTSIGINLYPNMKDYDYIFDLAKNYSFNTLRVSYVAPTCQFSNVTKDEYYTSAKDIFIPFVEKAKSLDIKVRLDCNHIPLCYFTDKEKEMMIETVENWHNYCSPVVDITPDMKGTSCFGAYELVDLSAFENIQEAERYFMFKKMYPKALANSGGKCSSCSKFENLSCQGGCLAFAGCNS